MPSARLFHLHFNVTDLEAALQVVEAAGLPLRNRYMWVGEVGEDLVTVPPGEEPPEDASLHLLDVQRGGVNLTLAPRRAARFDHLGVVMEGFDQVVNRARARGWRVDDPGSRRPFLGPPWGFRIECHPADDDVARSLGDPAEARLEEVVLAVEDPRAVEAGLAGVLGGVPGLAVRPGGEVPAVPRFRLAGEAFPEEGVTVDATRLA